MKWRRGDTNGKKNREVTRKKRRRLCHRIEQLIFDELELNEN